MNEVSLGHRGEAISHGVSLVVVLALSVIGLAILSMAFYARMSEAHRRP
jgi:hypothetical protein